VKPYLQDADLTLYQGDALEVLRGLPDGSVDCCVTSPPYWGLRDYGTGSWEGGDPDCDHAKALIPREATDPGIRRSTLEGGKGTTTVQASANTFRDVCGKCGASRVDRQLGLEATPEAYVARMVEVFREVRRVLSDRGTLWLNIGDSYNANVGAGFNANARIGQQNTVLPSGLPAKNLLGMPWRLAFALQADGWYLRADIIWAKPNPMPESVTDRPTKAHEYVFLLSKRPRYFFDQEAVREPAEWSRWGDQTNRKHEGSGSAAGWIGSKSKGQLQGGRHARRYTAEEFKTTDERNTRYQGPNPSDGGRNVRSVWEIATQPYPEAHFATYPEELVRRCILAGCPEQVCSVCGKARERIVERETFRSTSRSNPKPEFGRSGRATRGPSDDVPRVIDDVRTETTGWTDCGHSTFRPGVVLDPFGGSGTTALVARKHGRRSILVELSASYCALAADRLSQLSLLAEGA
jgi:DNA modification methylase